MSKKLPSALSEEELLERALSEKFEAAPEPPNNVVSFLLFYNITPGAFPVKRNVLYRLYTKYTQNAVKNETFYRNVSDYIPLIKTLFYINKNAFDIGQKTFDYLNKPKNKAASPAYLRHFQNFVKAHNLKSGSRYISLQNVYGTYREWAKNINRKKPLGLYNFSKMLKLHFPKHKYKDKALYIGLKREIKKTNKKINSEEDELA